MPTFRDDRLDLARSPFVDRIPGLMLIGLLALGLGLGFWLWPDAACENCDQPEDPVPALEPAPSSSPAEVRRLPPLPAETDSATPAPEASEAPPPARKPPETAARREERRLLSRLVRQGVTVEATGRLQRQERVIAPELMNQLSDSSNWMSELMKASSSIQSRRDGEPTRLALERVDADSVLWELGLQEGDVIVLIQGEIPHFSPTRALDYIRQADAALVAFDQGEPITLTVLRRGQPVHLVYQPW